MKRLTRVLVITSVLALLLTTSLSGAEMGEINCGETLSGEIAVVGQQDNWTFTASAGDRVLLSVMATSGALYPYVVVYAPDGSQEAGAYRHINQQMSQTGTYTVVIYDGDASYSDIWLDDIGGYNFTFVNLEGCSWPSISCDETVSGTIDAASDMDVWQFSASAGDRVLLTVMTTSGSLYPYVIVYAPDGSQEAGAYRHINQQMSQTGTYTVVIYDGDASYSDISLDDTGGYNFTFVNLESCSWPSISCDETVSGTIDAASDMDVWQFSASAGDRVLLTVMTT